MNTNDIKRIRPELDGKHICVITNEDRTYHNTSDVFIWDDSNEQLIVVRQIGGTKKDECIQILYVPYEDFVTMYTTCGVDDLRSMLASKNSAITSSGWTMDKIVDKFTNKWEKGDIPIRLK